MSWRLAHSLDGLRDEVNDRWPGRSKASDGTLGDPAHASRASDHNPDSGGVVRALDLTKWEGPTGEVAETVAETIRTRQDPRVKYVIWRGRMFASYSRPNRKAWEWGPYTGANGHFQHVHVSVLPGSEGDAPGPWGVYPLDLPPEEDIMASLDDLEKLLDAKLKPLLDDEKNTASRLRGLEARLDKQEADQRTRLDGIKRLVDQLIAKG